MDSTTVSFEIKWGKETIQLTNYNVSTGLALKKEISTLTNVPVDRMKVMPKSKGLWKGTLKDDESAFIGIDWNNITSKGGPIQILLMGTAVTVTTTANGETMIIDPIQDQVPKTKIVFLEDLPPEEIAKVAEPAGLVNLGNTCYLNSVVQCLRVIPQLRKGLQQYTPSVRMMNQAMGQQVQPNNPNSLLHSRFMSSLRSTYEQLDKQPSAYQPQALVQTTKMAIPQFAQNGPHGEPMQQDAEEFYSNLLTIMANETSSSSTSNQLDNLNRLYLTAAFGGSSSTNLEEGLMGATNMVDAIFGLKMEETLTCDELTTLATDTTMMIDNHDDGTPVETTNQLLEPPVISHDLLRKLVCNIQGGADGTSSTSANSVNHIAEGLQLSLDGKIEKHSNVLGRNAIWTRKQRIARLPPIVTVQFGRFYWKATPDNPDRTGVKCKVMRPVAFSSQLDMYEFCTEKVQKILKVARDQALAAEEDRINKKLKGEIASATSATTTKVEGSNADDTKMEEEEQQQHNSTVENGGDDDDEEMDEDLKAALALSMEPVLEPVGPGLPRSFQGIYELFAVVTHKGRDADGGHYMAWVKADHISGSNTGTKIADTDEENEDWYVFDDDEVSPCKTEDVLKLKGGGDWHMSYLNFYRVKK